MGPEDDEADEEDGQVDEVICDDIDSSRMLNEEVEMVILQEPRHIHVGQPDIEPGHDDAHIVGSHMEVYTGHQFSSCAATNLWIEWDAESHV